MHRINPFDTNLIVLIPLDLNRRENPDQGTIKYPPGAPVTNPGRIRIRAARQRPALDPIGNMYIYIYITIYWAAAIYKYSYTHKYFLYV